MVKQKDFIDKKNKKNKRRQDTFETSQSEV